MKDEQIVMQGTGKPTDYLIFEKNNLFGIKRKDKKVIILPEYSYIDNVLNVNGIILARDKHGKKVLIDLPSYEYHLDESLNSLNENNLIDNIIAYEDGKLSNKATLNMFSELVKTGMINSLQGSYARALKSLEKRGYIDKNGKILKPITEQIKLNELMKKESIRVNEAKLRDYIKTMIFEMMENNKLDEADEKYHKGALTTKAKKVAHYVMANKDHLANAASKANTKREVD